MNRRIVSIFLLLLIGGTAHAGMVSQWNLPDGKMFTLLFADKRFIRMDLGEGHQLLLLPEKNYFITRQGSQRIAVDLAQMGGMLQMMGGMALQNAEQRMQQLRNSKIQFKKTKRETRVGGYRGQVYQVILSSSQGQEQHEIVVSKHPDILALQEVFLELGKRAEKIFPNNPGLGTMNYFSERAAKVGIGGVLKYGNDLELRKIERKQIGSEAFRLPADATLFTMPVFPNFPLPAQ